MLLAKIYDMTRLQSSEQKYIVIFKISLCQHFTNSNSITFFHLDTINPNFSSHYDKLTNVCVWE